MPGYPSRRSFGPRNSGGGSGRSGQSFRPSAGRRGPAKQYIDPARFVQAAREVAVEAYNATNQFSDFAVDELIQRNIKTKGYTTPSKIQDIAIPFGLAGRDVVGIADTGSGKTVAFGIPIIQKLIAEKPAQALIIAPTRELAHQIEVELRWISQGTGIRSVLLIGGTPMHPQIRGLRDRPKIVIGTPGRIKDHVQQGNLKLQYFNAVVLDEVDRMVDMGFINDITFLLNELAPKRQSLFFSATMDSKLDNLVQSFLTDPELISVKSGETSANVEQSVVRHADSADKMQKLHDILRQDGVEKTLIFDETKRSVEHLMRDLEKSGFKVDALHGGKSQNQRLRALNKFRKNEVNILVATDVAARGIDISDITHVINYTTPQTHDDYVHRIGRAGRAGRAGTAMTFIGR